MAAGRSTPGRPRARHRDRLPGPRAVRQPPPAANFYAGRELPGRPGCRGAAVLKEADDGATREVLERLGRRCPTNVTRADVGRAAAGRGGEPRAAFASKVVILDEPTAALGLRESRRVLDLILRLRRRTGRDRGLARHGSRDGDRRPRRRLRRGRRLESVPSAETYRDRLADRGRWRVSGS